MAKESGNTYKISAAKEKLELGKINLVPDRYTLQEYLNKISENNTIDSNKIVEIDDFTVDVIVDGYVFRVTEDEDNDGKKDGHITYRYISELKNIQPEVVIKSLTTTTGTIKVEVKPRYAQNEEYEYYIKDGEAGENTYQKDGDKTTSTEHTFTGLTENKIYTIKVVLKMKGKNDATIEQNAKTVEMKTLSEAEMVFTDNPSSWTNTDVEVTVSVTNEEVQEQIQNGNYRIQTKLNDGSFEYSDSQTATAQNDTIGATVTDGYGNYTGAATHKVKYIDKQKPNATAPTLVDKTTSTIKVEYKQEDIAPEGEEASGIVTRKYRLTNAEGTEGEWKDSGIFEGLTHGQTYYVQTYAKDEAGNEQNSNVLTVELENVIDATGGSASPTSLTSSDVTVTLPTISGYTTRYTTNGDNPTLSSTEYTGPFTVPSNCTVKYVYTDGTNIGGAGIVTVSNIDKNTYTISYNMNGLSGVTHSNPKTSYKVDDNNFNLVNPSKSGYTFIGWTGGNYLGLDQYTTSNPYVCKGRDHFPGNEISVTPGTTYRVYVTAKRTRGSIALRGGIWYTQRTSGEAYDGYGEYTLEKDLGSGWGRYYRDVTVPEGKSKGKIFLQIEQSATAGWSTDWSVADMEIATTTLTVPKGSQGNKTYTAHWTAKQYTVTYEDWFVDGSNNRKTKLGSTTESKAYGTTVNGNELGTDTAVSKYYERYQYRSSTSATVGTNGATVYRYFWAWNNINVIGPNGSEYTDGTVAKFSVSYNGGNWVTGQSNETQASIILPHGATIKIKDITAQQSYYELNNVKWAGKAIESSGGIYTATVSTAGQDLNIYMKYKTYAVDVNPKINGTAYNSGKDGFTFKVYVDGSLRSGDGNNVKDWYQYISYGSKVKVVANDVSGYTKGADVELTVGTSNNNLVPTWTVNKHTLKVYIIGNNWNESCYMTKILVGNNTYFDTSRNIATHTIPSIEYGTNIKFYSLAGSNTSWYIGKSESSSKGRGKYASFSMPDYDLTIGINVLTDGKTNGDCAYKDSHRHLFMDSGKTVNFTISN